MTRASIPSREVKAETHELADGIFAYVQLDGSWWVNTAGFLQSDGEVLVIDTCSTAARAGAFATEVGRRAPGVVRRLVNTHSHGDHTYGNAAFQNAVIFGHDSTRAEVLADRVREMPPGIWEPNPDWGSMPISPPTVTFASQLTMHVGRLRVEVIYIGTAAHTRGDVVVWIPEHRVLYAGDLVFNGGTPMMMGGSVVGALDALKTLRSFDADVLVAGHGTPVRGTEVVALLNTQERYHRYVLESAIAGRSAGLPPLEVARNLDLGEFAALLDPERIVLNLHRAYADLDGIPDIDIGTAFADAISWNGGRPLKCTA